MRIRALAFCTWKLNINFFKITCRLTVHHMPPLIIHVTINATKWSKVISCWFICRWSSLFVPEKGTKKTARRLKVRPSLCWILLNRFYMWWEKVTMWRIIFCKQYTRIYIPVTLQRPYDCEFVYHELKVAVVIYNKHRQCHGNSMIGFRRECT